ncbi:MAG: hypothetical protein IJ371_03545 [Clostridia bacterium]|nr:hypothetical protein [Clostridia bacterium]
MSDKPQKSKFKWMEKLRNIKHIEIYITIIFALILILIFFSSTGSNKTTTNNTKSSTTQQTTITTYVSDMETRLEQILSQIQGASNVQVMLTLDMSNTSIKDNVIEVADFPEVKGVLIVAKGVENTTVKMNILKAVQSVIDISSGRIEILSSN